MKKRGLKISMGIFPTVLALILLCCASRSASGLSTGKKITQYSHDVWQDRDGLPQNSVFSLLQTHDGYLWLGTWEGLARFDGVSFTIFDQMNTPAISENFIKALAEDRQGNLWIGTNAGGLIRYKDGSFTTYTKKDGLISNNVFAIAESDDGSLWLGTGAGLTNYRNGKFTTLTTKDGLLSKGVYSLYHDHNGTLWIGTDHGLNFLRDGIVKNLTDTIKSSYSINTITGDREGSIWIGTNEGLGRYQNEHFTFFTTKDGLSQNKIQSLLSDRDGNLWVGTWGGGLNRYHAGKFTSYSLKEGLPGDIISSLYEDREGSLWVGTLDGGLNRFRDSKFTALTTKEGLSKEVVNSICEDSERSIWIATSGDGINKLKDGRFTYYHLKDPQADEAVGLVKCGRQGQVWAIANGVLYLLKNNNFLPYKIKDVGANELVTNIEQASDQSLWISTDAGVHHLKDGQHKLFAEFGSVNLRHSTSFHEDSNHNFWCGGRGGLVYFNDHEATAITAESGFSIRSIVSLYSSDDGTVWASDYFGGIIRLKDGKITHYTAKDGLLSDYVFQILEDSRHNLWMSSNKGLFAVTKKELDELAEGKATSVKSIRYDTGDGLKSRECRTGFRASDGRFWFRTSKGLAIVDPEQIPINTLPPPVVIERIVADKQEHNSYERGRMASGTREIEFQYTGLSLLVPGKVRFKYKLEGFDQDWVDAGTRRSAHYINLSPGEYRFHVLASNNDGVWNETGATYIFVLDPSFHQTTSFYLLCAAMIGLAGIGLHRMRYGQMKARFAAVFAERNRIARELHDTIEQGLAMVLLHVETGSAKISRTPQAAAQHFELACHLIKHNLAEVHRSVWDLHSPELEDGNFINAVSATVKKLTDGMPIQTLINVNGQPRTIPPMLGHNILRICQEAITNAVKHGRAEKIQVIVEFERQSIRLLVFDDGCGFDPGCQYHIGGRQFGLLGMKQRAKKIGGQLSIHSFPGGGTEVTVSAPTAM